MELYRVDTVLPECRRHRDVQISWFVTERDSPAKRPYAELVEGYNPADENAWYVKGAIDELFTRDEAEVFVAWLKANRETGTTATIVQEALPIPKNCIGLGSIPIGGPTDYLIPNEIGEGTFPLPFEVAGYFDVRGYEPIAAQCPAQLKE